MFIFLYIYLQFAATELWVHTDFLKVSNATRGEQHEYT